MCTAVHCSLLTRKLEYVLRRSTWRALIARNNSLLACVYHGELPLHRCLLVSNISFFPLNPSQLYRFARSLLGAQPIAGGLLEIWKQSGVSQLGSTAIRTSVSIQYCTSCDFNGHHGNHLVARENYQESTPPPPPGGPQDVTSYAFWRILTWFSWMRTLSSDEICRRMHEHLRVLVDAVEGYNATNTGGSVWE